MVRKPATAEEIAKLAANLDDAVVASIMRTGATATEVLEALQWLEDDEALEPDTGRQPHGVVRAVYEILQAEEPEE
jgi:phosphohistidine phosphatase SixA